MPRIQHGWVTPESGSWIGHFRKNGVPKAEKLGTIKAMTKTAAREALRLLIVRELGITGDGKATLANFITSKWVPLHEGQWRPSSRSTVLGKLKAITDHFDGVALEDIDAVQLQSYLNTLAQTQSGSTVRMARAYLRSIFAEATEQDCLRKNPARLLRVPKHLRPVAHPFLTPEQIKSLMDIAAPFKMRTREYALLRLFLSTGLRPSELFALRWRNVNLEESTLEIEATIYKGKIRPWSKTTEQGEKIVLQMPDIATAALRDWQEQTVSQLSEGELNPNAFLFPNADQGFFDSGNYLSRVLQPLAKAAGIPNLTYQMLRRTTATMAASVGDIKSVAAMLRHKQAKTTADIYAQAPRCVIA